MHFILIFVKVMYLALEGQVATRTEEIEKAREEKARTLQPEAVSGIESKLGRFKDEKYLERFAAGFNGWRPKIGNMATGGGFAGGLEYFHRDLLKSHLLFRASAQISTKSYVKFNNEWQFPRLLNERLFIGFTNTYRNYGQIDYYGPGPNSEKTGRSNYRLENTSTEVLAAAKGAGFRLGVIMGYAWFNIGPGQADRFISADKQYSPAVAPGIDHQTNYLRYGVFIQHDTRDNPLGPKSGGNYLFQYTWFDDRKLDAYNFRRIDAEVQQFFPFFNRSHVLGFRAKTVLTEGDGTQTAPFYLVPILGGSDDLRGYRQFRFSDKDSFVMNAEYRWQIFTGLDGAVFADAGKVFPRRGLLNFKDLESSVGFGLRFNARNNTFLRIDVGFSHEGFQLWLKFNELFAQRRFGASFAQPVF